MAFEFDFHKMELKDFDGEIYFLAGQSNEFFERKGYRFRLSDDEDHQIALIRFQGQLYAMENICPHRHADKIFEGILGDDLTVTCPLHGWTYSLEDGLNTNQKQGIRRLRKFKIIEEADGKVWIEMMQLATPKWRCNDQC